MEDEQKVTVREFEDRNKVVDKQFDCLSNTLISIKENHLVHIEKSMNGIENSHIELKTNTEWLLKFFWIIATVSIGGLITSIITLLKDKI
jgi:hypothetical protein